MPDAWRNPEIRADQVAEFGRYLAREIVGIPVAVVGNPWEQVRGAG